MYNPRSTAKVSHIEWKIEFLSMHRDGETPVGIVRNALRDGEEIEISTFHDIFGWYDIYRYVNNSDSRKQRHRYFNNRMITTRGYNV